MKPSIPQGTRDYSSDVVRKRAYIFEVMKTVFERFGFQPIETPAFENLGTLMGKYGDEGDRLIFKILNNGLNHPQKEQQTRAAFENVLQGKNDERLTERALRYDLTIPFARFVAMHQNDLVFPFRRYQMQPVWRADRPQKGRYREFWQCDVDIIGSDGLINEAELMAVYADVFSALKIPGITIRINNRKILAGLAECCGASERLTDITVAIDKMDKIGLSGVVAALEKTGLSQDQIHFIEKYLTKENDSDAELKRVAELLSKSDNARKGIEEIGTTLNFFKQLNSLSDDNTRVEFDGSLARGLNYYTGFIVEVVTSAVSIGSIGGGGRYDDLTGLFGLKGMSGVGVSFGVERIFDVMENLALFPKTITQSNTKILFLNLMEDATQAAFSLLTSLRYAGISCEIYPDRKKLDKQMKYANRRGIPFVGIIGDSELESGSIQLKNMMDGTQEPIALDRFVDYFKSLKKD